MFFDAKLVAGVLGRANGHGAVVLDHEDAVQEAGPLRSVRSRSLELIDLENVRCR